MRLYDKHNQQIEQITSDLKQVRMKTQMLADMQGLSRRQWKAIANLLQGIDGVRGWELGIARQALGLDQGLIDMTRLLKGIDNNAAKDT